MTIEIFRLFGLNSNAANEITKAESKNGMAGYEQVMSNHPVACSRLTRRIKAMFFEG
jgi:hypothetical protein